MPPQSDEQRRRQRKEHSRKIISKYNIKKLDMKKFAKIPGVTVQLGKTGSGKTMAQGEFLYHGRNHFNLTVGMFGSRDTALAAQKWMPKGNIYSGWHPKRLDAMYDKMEELVESGKDVRMNLILDDLAYIKNGGFLKSEVFIRMCYNCRHANIYPFVTLQYCKNLPPALREQANKVIICANKDREGRKKIFTAFNPCFKDFEEFNEVMKACTFDHNVMVLDCSPTGGETIADCVSYAKAKVHMEKGEVVGRNFKMGDGFGAQWDLEKRDKNKVHSN